MTKHFYFDIFNVDKSIKSMGALFNGLPFTVVADSNILGILIIASALHNIDHCKLLVETLRLLGYKCRAQINDTYIDLTIIRDSVYIQIVNNETAIWTKEA